LEMVLIGDVRAAPDKGLTVEGFGRLHRVAEVRIIDRHVAPAEENLAFLGGNALDQRGDALALGLVARQEEMADAVMARLGQIEAELAAFLAEKGVRDLDENARAVARLGVGADRAAMLEVFEDPQAVFD